MAQQEAPRGFYLEKDDRRFVVGVPGLQGRNYPPSALEEAFKEAAKGQIPTEASKPVQPRQVKNVLDREPFILHPGIEEIIPTNPPHTNGVYRPASERLLVTFTELPDGSKLRTEESIRIPEKHTSLVSTS